MAFSPTDELRIQGIELALNKIQTALNGVATKRELNNLMALFTEQVNELNQTVLDNAAGGLSAHIVDPLAHSGLSWYYGKADFVTTRTDSSVANKPVALNHSGYLDFSLLSGVL